MQGNPFDVDGLTDEQVKAARAQHGRNVLEEDDKGFFWPALKDALTEPMVLLLLAASLIYFLLQQWNEGFFMVGAILLLTALSLYQDSRSRTALGTLKALSMPKATVVRNGQVEKIPVEDVVVGDHAVAEEGSLLAADGLIVQSNDFSVNESILTGEAFAVERSAEDPESARVSKGTQVVSGLALYRVEAVGMASRLGRISGSLASIEPPPTPLQQQIGRFVRNMAIVGVVFFALVWAVDFLRTGSLSGSLLSGLTLAMSILPEEIPVAFTTFLALGAWRLARQGVIAKRATTVETLGAATVICTDKTGTITENRMTLAELHVKASDSVEQADAEQLSPGAKALVEMAMWASEPVPFDPMEKGLHEAYARTTAHDERPERRMAHEYPISGKPPMMTHVFANAAGHRIIACKGAPERILRQAVLTSEEKEAAMAQVEVFARKGMRVLGVGHVKDPPETYPESQEEYEIEYLGLVAFEDPPKHNIREVLATLEEAGIQVKIITGDNAVTTAAIARQVGFHGDRSTLDGEELLRLEEPAFSEAVHRTDIFTRMFPEAKMRIINALKADGHVVAMTGDGVNDAPALKAAHIGVAMGKRGSELAKEAASLVLTDDDLAGMVHGVAMGRRIYDNLKKAVQYIIAIHIPIILTVALPLFLGWKFPNIFTPMHVIFLELIMGPTCSIAYESEPLEPGGMQRPPRPLDKTFLSWGEIQISLWQGLVITIGTLASYQIGVQQGFQEELVRSLVFSTLIMANIGLTFVDRSFTRSFIAAAKNKNAVLRIVVLATLLALGITLYVPPVARLFDLAPLTFGQLTLSALIGFASVAWFEVYKWAKRRPRAGVLAAAE
jgi:Ca2+-transporting ATPase